jgi:dihydrolipoamide dehydrogenase
MYDLIIIGAGPGGYEAAIHAGNKGLNVLLVDKDEVGGTCLNYGCIPTKALYRNAEVIRTIKESDVFGVHHDGFTLDFDVVQNRKNEVKTQLINGIKQGLKRAKVELVYGSAKFVTSHSIEVEGNVYEGKTILISTGSKAKKLPIPGIDLDGVVTSKELLDINDIPKRLVVIGGGVIGLEMAGIFNEFGSEVTVVEYAKNILPFFDTDISKRLKTYLKKDGITVHTSTGVTEIQEGLKVIAESKGKELVFDADVVLVSTGRAPYFDYLGLEDVGIEFDQSGIKTSEHFETNIKGVYAVGDCIGGMMLAHTATYQSFKVLDQILSIPNDTNFNLNPAAVFVFPEIASVGLTETEAKLKYETLETTKFLFRANGKALAMNESDGFVKVIISDEKIIGCHIIGPHASDLIHEATVLMHKNVPVKEFKDIIHAHPTISEAFSEAVRSFIH